DRVEWFVQLSDQIYWDVEDRDSGQIRSKVVMKPGDVAAMPADIRHQGYAPKRSMLLVWENAAGDLPELISSGKLPTYPVELSPLPMAGVAGRTRLFCGGEFVDAADGATIPVTSPHDGSLLAEVAEAREVDVGRAVGAARAGFPAWSATSAAERGRALLRA